MPFFNSPDEVYEYVGGVFKEAEHHPDAGPGLKKANLVMQVFYTEPDCSLTVRMKDDYEVELGGNDADADVTLTMPADIADRFWRGEYNLAIGMAKGKVKARGPVNKILKLVPVTKPLFPIYRDMIAKKDSAAAV